MAYITQTTVMTDLSYLLGETAVPSSGVDDRKRYIQLALERVYRAYNFPMDQVTGTVSMVAGIATLPTSMHQDGIIDIRIKVAGVGTDHVFNQVDYSELDDIPTGQYAYYLNGYEGTYVLTSTETSTTDTLTVRYQNVTPVINASIGTPFPSSIALARGALVYYRQAEDPQADISQEEYIFQQELDEVIAQYNRARPQKRAKTLHEATGTYIGDTQGVGAAFDV